VPPPFARLLGVDATIRGATGDTAAETEFREALAALKAGTRIDSAALPGIVAHFSALLAVRGKGAEADTMLRRTLAWLPAGVDSSEAIVATLRRELRSVQAAERTPPAARTPPAVRTN